MTPPPRPAAPPRDRGRLTALLTAACALPPLLASANGAHWLLDLLSHFPQQWLLLALTMLVALLIARRWRTALLLLPAIALSTARLWPLCCGADRPPPADAARLQVLAANLCYTNRHPQRLLEQTAALDLAIVALTEFTPAARSALQPLRLRFAHAVEEPREGAFGLALWSTLPLREARVVPFESGRCPAIAAIVDTAAGPIGIVVAHPPPPRGAARSAARDRILAALPELLQTLPPRRLVLGDLNATRWSAPFAALLQTADLVDGCDGRGLQATWPAELPSWLGIPIDHALATRDLYLVDRRVGAPFGSDHRPLFATFLLPR